MCSTGGSGGDGDGAMGYDFEGAKESFEGSGPGRRTYLELVAGLTNTDSGGLTNPLRHTGGAEATGLEPERGRSAAERFQSPRVGALRALRISEQRVSLIAGLLSR